MSDTGSDEAAVVDDQDYLKYTFTAEAASGELDPELYDLLATLQPAGWEEADGGRTVRFWLARAGADKPERRAALERLASRGRLVSAAQEAGWQDGWRRFHRPVTEGGVRVRPPWYPPDPDLHDVVVDAFMAFGTGAHFTTRLCLRALQELPRGSLLDIGTGSGVLALAALRLGFSPVWAMDNDPVALEACARNAAVNGLEPRIFPGDITDPGLALPLADVAVANLLRGPILELARRLRAADAATWAPQRLLLSGLLVEQGDEVLAACDGYRLVERAASSGWLLLHLVRRA